MFHFKRLVAASAIFLGASACTSTATQTTPVTPNAPLGGDTNVAMAQVGNTFSLLGGIKIGTDTVPADVSMTVTKNEAGVATLKLKADLTKDPRLAKLDKLFPATMKDSTGKIDTEVKLRVTSDGIQDYFNRDNALHTTVNYASVVGDTYKLTKSNAVTITRTVVGKSDQDDFPYNGFAIKTMTIEQDSRIAGIKKFVYRANHRFGIVFFQIIADDGTTIGFYIGSKN